MLGILGNMFLWIIAICLIASFITKGLIPMVWGAVLIYWAVYSVCYVDKKRDV